MIFGMSKSGQDLRTTVDRFTIGQYYVAFYTSQATKRLADVETLKHLGFDYICTPCAAGDTALFSLCQSLGMGIMVEYNDDAASVLSAASSYGVVFAHVSGDDVDINFANAAAFASTESTYQGYDTNLLTLCSTADSHNKASEFAGTSDLYASQVYPIDFEDFTAMEYHYVPAKSAAVSANVPFLAHVQTCQLRSGGTNHRTPTVSEFNVMAWGAIQYGADGILMYSAYDDVPNGGSPITITDIFEITDAKMAYRGAMRNFISEVRRYEHFFLRGTRSNSYDSNGIETTWADAATGQTLRIVNDFSLETVTINVETT